MRDLLVLTGVLVLVPMAGLVFASTAGRVALFIFGLALFSLEYFADFGGHNPLSFIPFFGACLAVSALLAELLVRGARRARRRRTKPGDDEVQEDC